MNPTKPAAWRSFCPQFNRGLTFRLVLNLGKGHCSGEWLVGLRRFKVRFGAWGEKLNGGVGEELPPPPSWNRTCRFPASGSPMNSFTAR